MEVCEGEWDVEHGMSSRGWSGTILGAKNGIRCSKGRFGMRRMMDGIKSNNAHVNVRYGGDDVHLEGSSVRSDKVIRRV